MIRINKFQGALSNILAKTKTLVVNGLSELCRIRLAMETHGVHSGMLAPVPPPEALVPPFDLGKLGVRFVELLPAILIFTIWGLVQGKNLMRGDAKDRVQIKKREAEDKAEMKRQAIEDDKVLSIASMISNNFSDGESLNALRWRSAYEVSKLQ